jgi:hypothetical protein
MRKSALTLRLPVTFPAGGGITSWKAQEGKEATMRTIFAGLLLALLLPATAPAHGHFRLEKKEAVQKEFRFDDPQKGKTVTVDNVFGSITVRGTAAATVRLEATRTLRADTPADLEQAARDVTLKMSEKDNRVDIFVDGPFRCRDGGIEMHDPDYIVAYDFTLEVPARTDLVLKTVNQGDIRVAGVSGAFSVRNVNGRIEMEGIAGSGSCHTVNGRVRAVFRENPAAACSFRTVNGDVDVRFAPGLAADFSLKTLNGDMYSDFPVSYLPSKAQPGRREKGRFVYRSRGFQGVRVGKGGPEITVDTLNGDIIIANEKSNQGE